MRWKMSVLSAAAVVAMVATGCGGPANGVAGTAAATVTASPSALQLADAAAACLRHNGINVPDPTLGANGQPEWNYKAMQSTPQSVRQAANQACRSELVAARTLSPAQIASAVAAGVKYAQCMRQQGIANFPDPDAKTGTFTGPASIGGHGIDTKSPAFQKANRACKTFLAQWQDRAGAGG